MTALRADKLKDVLVSNFGFHHEEQTKENIKEIKTGNKMKKMPFTIRILLFVESFQHLNSFFCSVT